MSKLFITGGKSFFITKEKADKLKGYKWGLGTSPMMAKDKVIEANGNIFSVGDIKRIEDEETPDTRFVDRTDENRKWSLIKEAEKNQTSFEKTERMLRTHCFLLWVARGNRQDGKVENRHEALFKEPMYSKLFQPIFEWFEKNKEAYCPAEVWGKMIPSNRETVSSGWRRI